MQCKDDSYLCMNQPTHPSSFNTFFKKIRKLFKAKRLLTSNNNDMVDLVYLTVWSVACRSDHLMKIIPVNYLPIRNAPNTNFCIQRTADEVSIINRIKLNASHCPNQ